MASVSTRDKRVKAEIARLLKLYKDVPKERMKVVEGLIVQAARLRVLLDDMWLDITENGDVELFSQSEKQEPYERERPVARLYNNRDQGYLRIMKQLSDLFDEGEEENAKPKKRKSDGLL